MHTSRSGRPGAPGAGEEHRHHPCHHTAAPTPNRSRSRPCRKRISTRAVQQTNLFPMTSCWARRTSMSLSSSVMGSSKLESGSSMGVEDPEPEGEALRTESKWNVSVKRAKGSTTPPVSVDSASSASTKNGGREIVISAAQQTWARWKLPHAVEQDQCVLQSFRLSRCNPSFS